eukprot:3608265-Alexandrium_andersonii.AAC.1
MVISSDTQFAPSIFIRPSGMGAYLKNRHCPVDNALPAEYSELLTNVGSAHIRLRANASAKRTR